MSVGRRRRPSTRQVSPCAPGCVLPGLRAIEINYPGAIQEGCCIDAEWAPDDTSILVTHTSAAGLALEQVMLDPTSGTTSNVPWSTTTSRPTWQRLAD